ncbi:RecB family exonuclease [Thermovibrio sp.]
MVGSREELVIGFSNLRPWSFSKVQKAKKCQYEFFFRYVEKIKPLSKADFLVLGSAVHFVLENALNRVFKEGAPLQKKHLLLFAEKFKEEEPLTDVKRVEEFFPNILKFVNAQLRKAKESSLISSEMELAVDSSFNLVPYSCERVFMRGKLDFIFERGGTLFIVDHKTSRSWEFNNKVKTQLRWYALLASVKYPEFERFALEVHNVRYGTIKRVIFSKRELSAFKERLLFHINLVEKELNGKSFNQLTPSPSEINCRWCEYRHVCPLFKG